MNQSTVINKRQAVERLTAISAQIALLTLERDRLQQYLVGRESDNTKNGVPRNASGAVRNSIIEVLKQGPTTALDIHEKLNFPRPTIYATLTHLIKDRLIKSKKTDRQLTVYSWLKTGDKS